MKIGYARVSTDEQNLDLQLDALKAAGCEKIFMDQGVSGITKERAGLSEALSSIGKEDILVVWKLDRLGRSLGFLCELIEQLKEQGAGFHSLTDGIDTTTTGGKLVFHIMGALAEFERDLIRRANKSRNESRPKTRQTCRATKILVKRTGSAYERIARCRKNSSRSGGIVRGFSEYDWTGSEGKNEYEDHHQK